ncbi:GGDEF domain-containing protein [Brevibacillus choshinensis]|uniref:GGDEF domain-containing protein n=1 Tax=Brevibacillus choshinensis TaxID=54911 RepID=A0ABX7FLL7_BRECH|nr:GGDEF domain-containing protein [Brevibacillus choshinensis]QRG66735.1 GGDEF domain-containing protein [Brevibacillus choshinensis]
MERVPLTLLLFDVDHFKTINDTHGHYTGDRVLQDLTERISRHLRADDVFGRHGGDEFAILLPGMDEADSSRFAETIKIEIEKGSIPGHDSSYTIEMKWPAPQRRAKKRYGLDFQSKIIGVSSPAIR